MERFLARAQRPSTWLALAILALPFGSTSDQSTSLVTPADAMLVCAVAAAIVEVLRGRRLDAVRSLPAIAFLLMGATATVISVLAVDARLGMVGAVRSMELFFLVPITVLVAWQTYWDAWVVLGSLELLAIVEGTVGIVQRITHTGASIDGENVRAVGTFGAYNIASMATLTALGLIVGLACGVILRGRIRWAGFAVAAYLAVPLLFSLSRGAWLAAAMGAFVVLTRGRPQRMLLAIAAAGLVAAVAIPPIIASGSGLGQRVESLLSAGSDPDQSVKDRLALWAAARHMMQDQPLLGMGPRSFAEHRDSYADLTLLGSSDISDGGGFRQVALESPHNFYLLIASEQGMLSLTVYITALAMLMARGLVRAARPAAGLSTAAALAGTGMLGYELVDMLSGDLGGPNSVLVALMLGMAGWAAADQPLQQTDWTSGWLRLDTTR